jgi:sulfur relay (sulfurtransferase) complex TusBCD TusD component (DsrE family)
VTITAEASDPDGSISKVSFYSEGVLLGEDVSAPYTYDVASIASGTHVFTAIATDNVSATTTSAAVIITVNAANQLPVCAVTSPLNNALFTVPASVTITAEASDADGSISKVSFYSDGIFLGEDASAPYTYDVASIAAGIHVLTATATDNASATTISAAISITVNAPNQLPVCTITSPVNNSSFTVPVSLTITAEAADADGSISKVSFYNDGVLLGEDASAPYTYDVASIAAGNHVLTAITADNVSATTTSAAVNITVNAPNQLPACAITSPLNNASFTVPVSLTITAEASDPDGSISKVSFYSDGVLLGEDVSAPYTYDVASIAAGTHVFTAIATDNVSATTTSAAVNITVNAPNQLPACAITSPLNNAIFTAPVSVTITVEASDPDGIIQKVLFYEDEMLKGMDESAPYSWELSDQLTGQHLISAIAIDNKGDSSTICTTNITVQPPQAPVLLYPNNMDSTVSATSFLQWKKTVSLKAFQFQISDREDFADAKVDSIINDTLFSMSGKDFLPGRTKFWRVRARDGLNIGSWSDIWKFTILPEPRKVVLLNPERDTSYNVDSAVFVWSKMSLCDRYHFRLTSDSGMTDLIVDDSSLTDTVRVQKGLPINKTFWWSVKAHNQSGWGAFNPPRKFTISIPVTSVKEKCFVNFLNGLSNNQYKIDYGLSKTTHVTIRIFTAQGKLVRDVLSTTQKRGSYTLPITQSRLPKGCYILYFRTDEMLLTRMFIVSN